MALRQTPVQDPVVFRCIANLTIEITFGNSHLALGHDISVPPWNFLNGELDFADFTIP